MGRNPRLFVISAFLIVSDSRMYTNLLIASPSGLAMFHKGKGLEVTFLYFQHGEGNAKVWLLPCID